MKKKYNVVKLLLIMSCLGVITACTMINIGDKENCIDIDKGPLFGDKINANATCED